jgi:hypothetical protein
MFTTDNWCKPGYTYNGSWLAASQVDKCP